MSELRKKIDKRTDKVETNDLELQKILGFEAESATLCKETVNLHEPAETSEATITVFVDLQEEVLAVEKAVVGVLPVV